MIWFLLKGILRDRHRSFFPLLIVVLGTALACFGYSWFMGVMADMVDVSARFDTGHVKVVTQGYLELESQLPNDLGIFGLKAFKQELEVAYPQYDWAPRIKFGGLLDIPDESGETRSQGPVMGIALDLLSPNSADAERLNVAQSIAQGRMPTKPGEILITEDLAKGLGVGIGQTATLISATATGAMAIQNFTIVGLIRFGVMAMDRGTVLADLQDVQYALDMEDACGELLGFRKDKIYDNEDALRVKADFNAKYAADEDPLKPVMLALVDQRGLGEYYVYINTFGAIIIIIFIFAMSIVLGNMGLMNSIQRYGEIGVRLAIGESKPALYKSMLLESVLIGLIGSVIGTGIGLAFSYLTERYGFDMTGMMQSTTFMIQNKVYARVTTGSYIVGFIPGVMATTIGTAFAGIGIFKRQTATLFKELEG